MTIGTYIEIKVAATRKVDSLFEVVLDAKQCLDSVLAAFDAKGFTVTKYSAKPIRRQVKAHEPEKAAE